MTPAEPQPAALATTKRKFHKLLDNITASTSTPSLASTLHESNASTTSLDASTPPQKRSRLSDASMDKTRAVSGNERIRALQEKLFTPRKGLERSHTNGAGLRAVNAKDTPIKLSTPRKEPNFQPFSQEQFLGRLKTFADVKKWTGKPDAISEVQWAKRGWVCDVWNTVACKGGCEQRVVVELYPRRREPGGKEIEMSEDTTEELAEGLVEKYQALIVDGHYEDCLWRKRGCSDDIYHISIPNRAKSSAELLERYHSLKSIQDELPLIENIIYPDPPVTNILQQIPPTFFTTPGSTTPEAPPTSPSEITAFAFALFGWSGVTESKIALATCRHCFQRIGLWLYKDDRLQEMSTKLEVPIESLRLDLLESHREHCPWKNPDTQRNPKDGPIKDMAAWQTLEFLLLGKKSGEARKSVATAGSNDLESYRGSLESERGTAGDGKDEESIDSKWKKFKAKLRRTTSRRSVKSVKSVKSLKGAAEKDKENGKEKEKEPGA